MAREWWRQSQGNNAQIVFAGLPLATLGGDVGRRCCNWLAVKYLVEYIANMKRCSVESESWIKFSYMLLSVS